MIKEVKSYALICDNCGKTYTENYCDYSIWLEPDMAIEEAEYEGWIEHKDKHYCPNCYELDDNDNIVIKEREVENEH